LKMNSSANINVPFEGVDRVYRKQADNKDIRDLLTALIPRARRQMHAHADRFRGRNERETCRRIFDFLKNDLTYIADGGEQVIKLPSALLKYRTGDCKSYALFTAGVLENLRIPYSLVYTSYNANPVPGHVYVVTDSGCIIDAVFGQFDAEKTPTYKYKQKIDQKMNVRYMGSVSPSPDTQNGASNGNNNSPQMGACGYKYNRSGSASAPQTGISGPGLRRVVLAPGRGLFLGIVKGNLDGIAQKLQKVNAAKLKSTWENAGGNFEKLQNAIRIGSSKPARRLGLLGFIRKRLRPKGGVNGIGAAGENDLKAAILAGATAIGTAIAGPGAGTGAGASIGAALIALIPIVIDLVSQTPDAEMSDVIIPNPVSAETDTDSGTPGTQPGTPGTQPGVQPGTKFNFGGAIPLIALGAGALYLATRGGKKK
jgi:hypothetical protein